ncbi:zinc finger protein ZFAT-like isoform X2 [Pungitius pungitius]|uniref:zinc finger protein ZFAT-like isoform X2 n=1 Tax=Pungitius pungitius TaxID=134920 RepID=UPI001888B419|nr:zinc finger protein ZFAT-like isoform X2 [Pungitius pungitius]
MCRFKACRSNRSLIITLHVSPCHLSSPCLPAGAVFMCRLCHLFSPSRAQLLSHCSAVHSEQQQPPDEIIVALRPLAAEPVDPSAERPVKRKRGRPKGSKKKLRTDLIKSQAESTQSDVQRDKEKEKGDEQCSSAQTGKSHDRIQGLECRDCHRSFSNRRQIRKHICIREEDEEDEEDNGSPCGGAGMDGCGSLDPKGADPLQSPVKPGPVRKKGFGSFKPVRTSRRRTSKEGGPTTVNKMSVFSVVLTEDETLPGVSKMVPVDESSEETIQPQSAVLQSQSQDLASEATICEGNPETDQEPSVIPLSTTIPRTTTTAAAANRGFQEYSIKQDATNLLQSQLKIFSCEFCNKIFKFRHSLMAHLRTHTQEKPFQCPHCDYASAIKANLSVHLRKHTGEKFSCQHCPFNCLSPGHLKVHIERVHLKVKQHCSFCEKKYSDVKNLLKHIEKRHNMKDPAIHQSYQQLRLKTRQGLRQLLYHCPTCNRRFKNLLERERHLLVHGPRPPFACLICDHASTKMATLAAHVRKHLFLYMCCVCDGKFVSSQRLRSHLKESHQAFDQEQAFTDCINISYYLVQPGGGMWGEDEREETGKGMKGGWPRIEQEGEDERMTEEATQNGVGVDECCDGKVERLKVAAGKGLEQDEEEAESPVERAEKVPGKEGEMENGSEQQGSQDGLHQAVSTGSTTPSDQKDEETAAEKSQDNTADTGTPSTADDTHAAESRHTPLLENSNQENTNPSDENTPTPSGENGQTLSEGVTDAFQQSAFQKVISSLQKTPLNMESFQRLRKIYGELECQYCGKLFWYKVHYNAHVRTHTKEHSHYCSKCSYSSITKSSLKRHLIQKHSGLLLPCSHPACQYTTPDKYKLQDHLKTHQEQGQSVTCPVCQKSYSQRRLKQHIKASHPETLPMQGKGLMVQRAEKCPYCDSYFLKNSSDFQRHIWFHQGVKPFVCHMCDYAGRSRSNLKTHMNRHNTERHHLCDLCGKKFKSKNTLKSHRLSHSDEGKRFKCSECDFTSVFKPSLLRHMEQHAQYKPFRCAHCHYSCNIARPLKRHYNMKHPTQKYQNVGPGLPNPDALKQQGGMKCPECEFVYGTKWELNRHLKRKHSLKVVEGSWEVGETVEAQFVALEDEEQLTEVTVASLQDNVDIQQTTECNSETLNAVTSMVAMAPGTVTVVQQVAGEQEDDECTNQLMVVNADGDLSGDQVMVVEDAESLEALSVLAQGDNTHHYIVYVQEHTVEIN